jgi:hypothetical protein
MSAVKPLYQGDTWLSSTKRVYAVGMIAEILLDAASLPWDERVTLFTQVSEILTDREIEVFCSAASQGDAGRMRSIGENVRGLWRTSHGKGKVI